MRANLSLMGMFEYEPDILDEFVFPAEWDKDTQTNFKMKLIFDTAELSVVYTNPDFLKKAIGFWSRSYIANWEKLYRTEHFDYNPIWNKDSTITETESIGRTNSYSDTRDGSGSGEQHTTENTAGEETTSNTQTNDLDQVNTSTTDTTTSTSKDSSANSTVKDYVFGFNETSAAQSEEHVTDSTGKENGSGTEKVTVNADQINTGTVTNAGNSSSKGGTESTTTDSSKNSETVDHSGKDDETRNFTHTEQGNIGITTTQQMIRQEREVDKFSLQDYIIDSFKQNFCILVY